MSEEHLDTLLVRHKLAEIRCEIVAHALAEFASNPVASRDGRQIIHRLHLKPIQVDVQDSLAIETA